MKVRTSHIQLFIKRHCKKYPPGFTLTELGATMAIIAVLSSLAVPTFNNQIPNMQLRRAARDLYSHMQWTKMQAIKDNTCRRVIFNPIKGQEGYSIWSEGLNKEWDHQGGDDVLEMTIRLENYSAGITFGQGNAQYDATINKGKIPKDGISYQDNQIRFHPIGTIGIYGYVYLCNNKGTNYAVGTPVFAGVIVLRKWKGNGWE